MEEWKYIPGYENIYQVSNLGNVRSVDRIVYKNQVSCFRSGRIKKQSRDKDGYLVVNLSKDGKQKKAKVHRLVAEMFVDGKACGSEVNHKDFNRENNSASNLEWVTHLENVTHSIHAGRHVCCSNRNGENNPNYNNHKLSEKYKSDKSLSVIKQSRPGSKNGMSIPVTMVDVSGTELYFGYTKECAEYLILHGLVSVKNVEYMSTLISKCKKENKKYNGIMFK